MDNRDYIEVGGGSESKVIGKDNSISEYMTTILALGTYLAQGLSVVWICLVLAFYWVGLTWAWSAILALIAVIALSVLAVFVTLSILKKMKDIQEPQPVRDERGMFRKAKHTKRGKYVGDVITTGKGQTEYIERWGGGG